MRDKERQAWTAFVEKRENANKVKRPRRKKPEVPQKELEAALDDLATEQQNCRDRAKGHTP